MAGPDEIRSAAVGIGQSPRSIAALFGRNPGGQAMATVDRYGKGGAERRVVHRHHRIEMQTLGLVRGKRRTYDAGSMANDESHFLRCAERGRDKQIAFVLAVVVIA